MSSTTQPEGSAMIQDLSTISGPKVCNGSDLSAFSATGHPRKPKYYNLVPLRCMSPHYQHISIIRYRTEEPYRCCGEILIPQNIGLHVIEQGYRAPRTAPPFQALRPEDLFFPLTPLREWSELEQEGIDAVDELLTVGQIVLAQDWKFRRWMCKPSPLRSSMTYMTSKEVSHTFSAPS